MSSSTAVTRDYGKRVAIVTGAARGMSVVVFSMLQNTELTSYSGRSIAIRLAEDGFDVCINDISANQQGIDSVVSEIRGLGRDSCGYAADVAKSDEVENLVAFCVETLGPLNVMVANAGIAQVKAAMELTDEDLRRMFDINVFGLFNSYRAAARQMIKQGNGGQIIGAASIVAFKPFAMLAHYSASKFAVRGFTQVMAMELAEHKITVNAYAPGVVGTAMWDQIDAEMGKAQGVEKGAVFKSKERDILLGRTSVPEDVSKAVSFLASPDAAYMTGQTLVVDGGMVYN